MKREVKRTRTENTTYCDICGKEAVAFARRIKKCHICGIDVCAQCAIITDHWYLTPGEFEGDYPDHYCKPCWGRGSKILSDIQLCRDKEGELWDKWKEIKA